MTKQEKINKYMKKIKEYIIKDFIFVKELEDEDGVAYLFIKDENFYYVYSDKDDVYIQRLGPVPVDNKPHWLDLLIQEKYKWMKKED